MLKSVFSNGNLKVEIQEVQKQGKTEYFIESVKYLTSNGWESILKGEDGKEFYTSFGASNATELSVVKDDSQLVELSLSCSLPKWEGIEFVKIDFNKKTIERKHTYRFKETCNGSINPGWQVFADKSIQYTYPLQAHSKPFSGLEPMRADVAWALPLPFHVWNTGEWVAIYGVNKNVSSGTIDFQPANNSGYVSLGVFMPDSIEQNDGFSGERRIPQSAEFAAGTEVSIVDTFMIDQLGCSEIALVKAEKMAGDILLQKPYPEPDLIKVANGITDFYHNCELWDPDALGRGRGWFINMWMYTTGGPPKKRGVPTGFYDMGWGEGVVCEVVTALTRNWRRTKRTDLLKYIDEMTESFHLFKRSPEDDSPYYDRSDGNRFGDFGMHKHIWSHSLGHTGNQLLKAYIDNPDYPRQDIRKIWLETAATIVRFFNKHQKENGDIIDIFDKDDNELNKKQYRITARAVVCGLWTNYARVTGDSTYIDRALRLAKFIAPEVNNYDIYNQMIDGLDLPHMEIMDGEAAYYIMEGLTVLYEDTKDPEVLVMCEKAAAFGICWTYFFDVPGGNKGIARGGQVCRMPDFPLLYPIGPAKAVEPMLHLYKLTGDPFYEKMAEEMVKFIGNYQFEWPGKPWHGGMIHAMSQFNGKHWGPEKLGQVDSGMATGNSLAAIEKWLEYKNH